MPLLQVTGLSYGAPDGQLLARDVRFTLNPGELLFVSGPNGAGKSTLLRVLMGQAKSLSGTIQHALKLEEIAYLPQLQSVAFHLPLTLWDVLLISCERKPSLDEILSWGLLERQHLSLSWNTASGGERRRALLTRALLQAPKLLILDEPLNHLDRHSRERVGQVMDDFIVKDPSRSIILVSHEIPAFSGRFPIQKVYLKKESPGDE